MNKNCIDIIKKAKLLNMIKNSNIEFFFTKMKVKCNITFFFSKYKFSKLIKSIIASQGYIIKHCLVDDKIKFITYILVL